MSAGVDWCALVAGGWLGVVCVAGSLGNCLGNRMDNSLGRRGAACGATGEHPHYPFNYHFRCAGGIRMGRRALHRDLGGGCRPWGEEEGNPHPVCFAALQALRSPNPMGDFPVPGLAHPHPYPRGLLNSVPAPTTFAP